MTNELDFRINARLNEGQMEWYKKFAKLNKVKISELLRLIPDLYDKLDLEVDELSGKVNDLSIEINGLRPIRHGSVDKEFKEMFDNQT